MRALLVSVVIGMGILIVAGMGLLVYGLIQKQDNPDFKFFNLSEEVPELEQALKEVEVPLVGKKKEAVSPTSTMHEAVESVTPKRAFGDMRLEIPAGYKVVETEVGAGRLVLRMTNDAGMNRLMFLDLNTGAKLGGLSLHPAE